MKNFKFLEWGYKTAIFLCIFSLVASSVFLFYYLSKSHPEKIDVETMAAYSSERKMVLLSTAIFVAMAFGFLGFALFLIQAHGDISAKMEHKDLKMNISHMSPGVFVILCATVIIIFAMTANVGYQQNNVKTEKNPNPSVETKANKEGSQLSPADDNLIPNKF